MSYTLLTAKVVSAIALAALSMVFGLLPYYLVKWFYSKGIFRTARVRAFINGVICFSGGTLIGVAFLHLMPEMREKLEKMKFDDHGWIASGTLSVSDVLTCSGFFFVYIFDELMHMFIEWCNSRRERRDKEVSESELYEDGEIGDNQTNGERSRRPRRRKRSARPTCFPCVCQAALSRPFHHPDSHNRPTLPPVTPVAAPVIGHIDAPSHHSPHQHNAPPPTEEEELMASPGNPLAGLIMIIALSFHDIFEGLAVGIESDIKGVLFLYISIAAHKYAIAFCIGMDLIMNHTRYTVLVLYMITYSIVSPIGIIVGIFITNAATDKEADISVDTPVTVVLQGLAGGTLIYVVCFEILQREGSDTHMKGICNVIMVLIGFLITLGIKVTFGHGHHSEVHQH